ATEAELAVNAGRYQYAAEVIKAFPDKTADPKDLDRITRVTAQVRTAQEQYDSGKRLLRPLVDEGAGGPKLPGPAAAGGGPVAAVWGTGPALPTQLAALAAAAEQVYGELHPDTAGRVEFFINLADQVQREKAAGKEPSKKPEELLATAISGWAKGKNAATPL